MFQKSPKPVRAEEVRRVMGRLISTRVRPNQPNLHPNPCAQNSARPNLQNALSC